MLPDPEANFDPRQALAELARAAPQHNGRKLSFVQKCGAFAALSVGVNHALVARAFGVSAATISFLAACLKPKHGRARYPEIADEYKRLGGAEFESAYYTHELHTRLTRIKHNVAQATDERARMGANPKADRYAFSNFGSFTAGECHWRIDWTPGDGVAINGLGGPGWRFIDCDQTGAIPDGGGVDYRGLESTNSESAPAPFRTSAQAYRAVFINAE